MGEHGRRVGVLVVHGIGQQARGATLRQVGEPLVDAILTGVQARGGTVALDDASLLTGGDGPERLTIDLALAGRTGRVVLAESWWAESFIPTGYRQMIPWAIRATFRAAIALFRSILRGMGNGSATLRNQARQLLDRYLELADQVGRRSSAATRRILAMARGRVVETAGNITFVAQLLYRLTGLLLLLALPFVVVLVPFVLVVPIVLSLFRATRDTASSVRSGLAATLGDARTFQERRIDRAAMVEQVQRDLDTLREDGVDEIVVIAHSLGAAITYRALVQDVAARADVTLYVTVGGAIRITRADDGVDDLAASLADVDQWLDLHTSFDPVPAGPLPFRPGSQAVSVRVANHQSPFTDHTTYFTNVEQVVAPLAVAVLARALPAGGPVGSTDWARTWERDWARGTDPIVEMTGRTFAASELRHRRKSLMATLLLPLIAGLAGLAAVLSEGVEPVGRRAAELLADALPAWLLPDLAPTATGWATVGLAGLVVLVAVTQVPYGAWDRAVGARVLDTGARLHRTRDLLWGLAALLPGVLAALLADGAADRVAAHVGAGSVVVATGVLVLGEFGLRARDLAGRAVAVPVARAVQAG